MNRLRLFTILWGFASVLNAQLPYTNPQFGFWEEPDVYFGTSADYNGAGFDLYVDLYKPLNDGNCLRPVLVMVHGGAFVAGTRKDPEVVQICREMARRGYLAVSVEYRLGNHKNASYTQYAVCPTDRCTYVADSLEVYRSLFRGVQDVKGAMRYLQTRQEQDSSDLDNLFLGGVSAGGFIALQTAIWDEPAEKPAAAFALPDVAAIDPDLLLCYNETPQLARPDLGGIEGELYSEQQTPAIRGVANFFGGILGSIDADETFPPTYLFHQTNDLIVDCGVKSLLGGLYQHCILPLNLCQPLYQSYPKGLGSCAIEAFLESLGGDAPPYVSEIINTGPTDGLACLANPPGHSILNVLLRCHTLSGFFAPIIAASGNDPVLNCTLIASHEVAKAGWEVFPNPFSDQILLRSSSIQNGPLEVCLFTADGQRVWSAHGQLERGSWTASVPSGLPSGIYWLQVQTKETTTFLKMAR